MNMDADRIGRIARRIVALSQIIKNCEFMAEGGVKCVITEEMSIESHISLDDATRKFRQDVLNEMNNVGVMDINRGRFEMNQNDSFYQFKYIFVDVGASQDLENSLRSQHEWVISDKRKPE